VSVAYSNPLSQIGLSSRIAPVGACKLQVHADMTRLPNRYWASPKMRKPPTKKIEPCLQLRRPARGGDVVQLDRPRQTTVDA
jgi:hypothetical protein